MGSRISIEACVYQHRVQPSCLHNSTWSGEYEKGNVATEPDIAGVGVVSSFIGVTAATSLACVVMLLWKSSIAFKYRSSKIGQREQREDLVTRELNVASVCDRLIATCSDQQIVVGSAYLWSVHSSTGCTTSFYHLMIVSNMIVLSCATHLLCIVGMQRYWKNPWIATVRICLIFAVIGFAGRLMSGGYGSDGARFPTALPETGEQEAIFFLPSPCFMRRVTWLSSDIPPLDLPAGGRRFLGWNMYLMVVSYSAFAVVVTLLKELFRPPPRDRKIDQWGLRKLVHRRINVRERVSRSPRLFAAADWIYRIIGVLVASAGAFFSADAILDIRGWAENSGWLETEGEEIRSPEQDIDTLGQTLPLFSCALIGFVLVEEAFNELKSWRRRRAQKSYESDSFLREGLSVPDPQGNDIEMSSRHSGSLQGSPEEQQRHRTFRSSETPVAESQPLRGYDVSR